LQLISSVGLIHSIEAGEDYTMIEIGWDQDDDESDEESNEARARVIRKYETAERQIIKSKQEEVADKQVAFDEALSAWKRDYYKVNIINSLELCTNM
jgi:threonyl-tRNA synthetase